MIELLTAGTPNGHKVSITLEELALPYKAKAIDLAAREQKQEDFLALNPNGRIPVIIDHAADFQSEPFVVFESGAILLYLAEKTSQLLPQNPSLRSQCIQWLMFQMGGLGPMMGQSNVFRHYANEKIPYAIKRYEGESRRLLEVLNRGLQGKEFLAEEYSIADIANYAWARGYAWSGANIDGLSALRDWLERIEQRPAVQKGLLVPSKMIGGDENNEADKAKTIEQVKEFLV